MSDLPVEKAAGAVAAGEAHAGPEPAASQKEWQMLRSRLQAEKERVEREISSYSTPIAGCDQQFNYLLEKRAQLRREWRRLLQAEQV